jgi:nucleotide-binding universal stress UspA family protein
MKPERILLPIDLARCPPELFDLVNGIDRSPSATVILLHVVGLQVPAPDNRVYEELSRSAASRLEQLARTYLQEGTNILIRVRTGRPVEEIIAEARAEHVDLIILPAGRTSFFKHLFAPIAAPPVEKIVRKAPCAVLVANQVQEGPLTVSQPHSR